MAAATSGAPAQDPGPAGPELCVVIPTLGEAGGIAALVGRLTHAEPPSPVQGLDAGQALDAADRARADRATRVVVADGGSADDTLELARAAGAEVCEAPRGRGPQLAAGAELAREDLLLFLHADTWPEPGAIAALRRAFRDPTLGYAGLTQRIAADGRFYRWVERAADRRVERGMVYGDSGLAVRRELYTRVGGFAALPLFEDVDLSRRLGSAGKCARVPDAVLTVSARRWQREGTLRTTLRNWMLRLGYGLGMSPHRLSRLYAPHGAAREST